MTRRQRRDNETQQSRALLVVAGRSSPGRHSVAKIFFQVRPRIVRARGIIALVSIKLAV